tara:strand:+ start:81 stop:584 length:504 start_codon:yes stop_codon:yes gene_type:complete
MIISCRNCEKQFRIDTSRIPEKGRNLQCGSCGHTWFYKIEDKSPDMLTLNDEHSNNEIETNKIISDIDKTFEYNEIKSNKKPVKNEKKVKKLQENQKTKSKKTNEVKSGSKFFSNLVVCIISFFAIIILIDTLKEPLINIFPASDIILLNLFETLHDIKLFIIDLFN